MKSLIEKLKRTLAPDGSLVQQSVTSGVWVSGIKILTRVLQLGMVIVLGRLLTPEEFGIMGVALLVLSSLRRFSQLGLTDALIYNENENIDKYLNTAWVLNTVRGAVIGGLVVVSAPYVAMVFSEPRVAVILPPLAISPLLAGAKNPALVYFKKDLNFHKQFAYEVSAAAMLFVVAVAYALINPTIWALVAGYISTAAVRFFVSYLIDDYRPRPNFDLLRAKEMVNYGKWITGANITNFIRTQGDDAFVGWFLSSSALGFYQMAYRFSNAPATEIANVISSVAFPAYSQVQDDIPTLRTGFFRVIRVSILIAAPAGVGIAVVAPTFVRGFLGEEWLPMVFPMQILALYAVPRAIGSTYGTVWRAVGRPDYVPKLEALSIVLIAAFIYPAADLYGISGVSFVLFAILTFIMLPIHTYVTVNILNTTFRRVLLAVIYPLGASAVMAVVVSIVQAMMMLGTALGEFAVLVIVGIVTYVATALLLDTQFDWEIRQELRSIKEAL